MAELDEDVALSLVDKSYLVKRKKCRAIRLISLVYEQGLEKSGNDSDLGVYDLCDLDISTTNGPHVDETDGPSTSGRSSNSPDRWESSKALSVCFLCLSETHESKDCRLRLDDSDTEKQGLSQIL